MALLPRRGRGYIAYLDNLFTNVKLLRFGRKRGWGITGTATGKSGIIKKFSDMKTQDKKKDEIPWGTLYTEPSTDNLINYIAWKDNALVLFMPTVNDGVEKIEKMRKRPSETSTSAKTARLPFGDHAQKLLEIPEFDELYNHEMGAVDEGNKLKRGNTCEMICRRGGHLALITWLLDTVIVNSYLLSFHSAVTKEEKFTDQTLFRTAIIEGCFKIGSQTYIKRKHAAIADVPDRDTEKEHSLKRREIRQDCVVCKKEGISREKRRVLGETSANTQSKSVQKGCRRTTAFGCEAYDMPLCKDNGCWQCFHSIDWNNK